MEFIGTLFTLFAIYVAYKVGQLTVKNEISDRMIQDAFGRGKIPIGVIDKVDNHYYVYNKDTNEFICQASSLEELPNMLYEHKKITLALLLYPEEEGERLFWCINGKLKLAR